MEHCELGSVTDVITNLSITLTEEQIAYICRGTLRALEYLHSEKSIIHRDIKGRNILLTRSGEVKLTDFGGAKEVQSNAQRMKSFAQGSPYWMAPEIIDEVAHVFNSDVWSLGITVIELAEHFPPRSDLSAYAVMKEIVREPPPTLSDSKWSSTMRDFVAQCLVKNFKNRPSVEMMLEHPFITSAPRSPAILQEVAELTCEYRAEQARKEAAEAIRDDDPNCDDGVVDDGVNVDADGIGDDLDFKHEIDVNADADTLAVAAAAALAKRGGAHRSFTVSVTQPVTTGKLFRMHTTYKVSTYVHTFDNELRCFSVNRRFRDFVWLHQHLRAFYGALLIPPLPRDTYFGRFKPEFIEERRRGLEVFLQQVISHPRLSKSTAVDVFLHSDNDEFAQAKDITHADSLKNRKIGRLMTKMNDSIANSFENLADWNVEHINGDACAASYPFVSDDERCHDVCAHTAVLKERVEKVAQFARHMTRVQSRIIQSWNGMCRTLDRFVEVECGIGAQVDGMLRAAMANHMVASGGVFDNIVSDDEVEESNTAHSTAWQAIDDSVRLGLEAGLPPEAALTSSPLPRSLSASLTGYSDSDSADDEMRQPSNRYGRPSLPITNTRIQGSGRNLTTHLIECTTSCLMRQCNLYASYVYSLGVDFLDPLVRYDGNLGSIRHMMKTRVKVRRTYMASVNRLHGVTDHWERHKMMRKAHLRQASSAPYSPATPPRHNRKRDTKQQAPQSQPPPQRATSLPHTSDRRRHSQSRPESAGVAIREHTMPLGAHKESSPPDASHSLPSSPISQSNSQQAQGASMMQQELAMANQVVMAQNEVNEVSNRLRNVTRLNLEEMDRFSEYSRGRFKLLMRSFVEHQLAMLRQVEQVWKRLQRDPAFVELAGVSEAE
jgi:Protein kinase domain/PX domain